MKRLTVFILFLFTVVVAGQQAVFANGNDYGISDFQIDYRLSRDSENRSRLTTTETITVNFTTPNQNHGIERAIPTKFDGRSTSLAINAVTDDQNRSLNYTTYDSNDNTVVRIGDADKYVQGIVTYVISYTQRDVTRHFADTNRDEFYWDTNGNSWNVPIEQLTVSLTVDDAIAPALTSETACYKGVLGTKDTCQLFRTSQQFLVEETDLRPRENVTIAVGFSDQTFAAYQQSPRDKLLTAWGLVTLIAIPIASIILVILIVRFTRLTQRSSERGSIVTEYLPPEDTSVTTAATVINNLRAVFTAQLLDFAVRHYVKLYQTKEKTFWKKAEFDIEIAKDIQSLKAEEREIIEDIFGGTPAIGQRLALSSLRNNRAVAARMLNNESELKLLVRGNYALRERNPDNTGWFKKRAVWALVIGVLLLNIPFLLLGAALYYMSKTIWSLTDKGLALSTYLSGLKQYISIAESDRIQQMQSPEGAAKMPAIDINDKSQLVKLYEKVLPYAVLFGKEKEWNKQIGQYYESTSSSPVWYEGNNAVFSAAVFSSSISNFSSAASYTAASSSSSGGSSGGGFSGGGGGGGGGGAW